MGDKGDKLQLKKRLKIALAGNPNSGKTTLFNVLTGLNQQVGNFPGVTVDKKSGACVLNKGQIAEIIDLPGTYSLFPKSIDEEVTSTILFENEQIDYPDITIIVVDASNLKRSLLLASQIIDLQRPCVLALNMFDEAETKKININIQKLSELIGVEVVPLVARKKIGFDELKVVLSKNIHELVPKKIVFKLLNKESKETSTHNQNRETIDRYRIITEILNDSTSQEDINLKDTFSYKIDTVLTHKLWGYLIFLFILFLIFQVIFSFSSYPMDLIDSGFGILSEFVGNVLPKGILNDLIVGGVLAGLSGVVIFIPQIALLFAFIAILEDTGYMARVSFIMDKPMRKLGLNGKSIIPLISGAACAVPAIMSTRTIGNWKERLITILVTPLMSCSARIPVYTLMISLVIPSAKIFGVLDIQGLTLLGLYLIGFLAAIGSAYLFNTIIKSKENSYFIMEMPTYRAPRWKSIGLIITEKVKIFIFEAGKIIIAISIILWGLSSFGPKDSFQKIDKKYDSLSFGNIDAKKSAEKLEASYAGIVGKAIEPVIKPLGFDWKTGIALITSFAAREVFVGTMATIYSVSDPDNNSSIREKMRAEKIGNTNLPRYNVASGLSLMIFYAFAMQCMSTIAVVYRETKTWKWPLIQFLFFGVLAYVSSLLVYNLLS